MTGKTDTLFVFTPVEKPVQGLTLLTITANTQTNILTAMELRAVRDTSLVLVLAGYEKSNLLIGFSIAPVKHRLYRIPANN